MTTIYVLIACFPTVAAVLVLMRIAARIGLFDDPQQASFIPLRADNRERERRGLSGSATVFERTPARRRIPFVRVALAVIVLLAMTEAVGIALYAEHVSAAAGFADAATRGDAP